jgi:cation-transporting ATPase I
MLAMDALARRPLGGAVILLGIVQTPGLSQVFGCTPLDPLTLSIAGTTATGTSIAGQILPAVVGARASL